MNQSFLPDTFLAPNNTDVLDLDNYNTIYTEPIITNNTTNTTNTTNTNKVENIKVIERLQPPPQVQQVPVKVIEPYSQRFYIEDTPIKRDDTPYLDKNGILLLILIIVCICILNVVKDIRDYLKISSINKIKST